MKKTLLFAFISLPWYTLNAQSFYIKPYGGFGAGIHGTLFNLSSSGYYENQDTNYTTYSHESAKVSFGNGAKFGLALGTDLTKNIAFELTTDYSKGKSQEIIMNTNYAYHYDQDYTIKINDKYNLESSSVQITPSLLIKSSNRTITPYFKFGVIIGITRFTEKWQRSLFNTIPTYYPFESWSHILKYDRTVSVGITSAMGCEYYLFEDFYIFAEGRYSNFNATPRKSELTEYKYRGEDRLETLPVNERKFEYVAEYSDADNINPDKPGKNLISQFALSNITFIAGFRLDINFNKTEKVK